MANNDFQLTMHLAGPAKDGPAPARVSFPLAGYQPAVGKGDAVRPGTLIARAVDPEAGDLHSPITGTVSEIRGLSEFSLVIEAGQVDDASVPPIEPRDLSQKPAAELRRELAELGIDVRSLRSARTLIINAMPPEPGITVPAQLLADYRTEVARGLEAAKRIVSPAQTVLAGMEVDASALGNCQVKHLRTTYPAGLSPLVAKAVTGSEAPEDTAQISVLDLFLMGRVMESGLPSIETMVRVGGHNVMALIGTPAGELLAQAGTTPREKDRIVLGGPMRGSAQYDPGQGIMKHSLAVLHIPHEAYPPTEDNPCLNCGECVLSCPARILPNLISRAAEFSFFDRARGYGVDHCFECGICGYVCAGRRPLLQYIRLAKKELAALDEAAALKEKQLQMAGGEPS